MESKIPAGITLNNRFYSTEQFAAPEHESDLLTKNEVNTLRFCHQWLTGQKAFMIKTSGCYGKSEAHHDNSTADDHQYTSNW